MAEAVHIEARNLTAENDRLKLALGTSAMSLRLLAETLERDGKTGMVEELGAMTEELVQTDTLLLRQNQVLGQLMANYPGLPAQPEEDEEEGGASAPEVAPTDWKALVANGMAQLEEQQGGLERHDWIMNFKRAVWNVNNAGQPMPGDEEEELVEMTQAVVKNNKCPFTLQEVTALTDPICCSECRHIYSEEAIRGTLRRKTRVKCPVAGCSSMVRESNLVSDGQLKLALAEMRARHGSATGGSAPVAEEDIEEL